jgi:hypothetical protein
MAMTPTSKGTLHVAARGIADGASRTGQCPMGRLDARGRIDLGGIDASSVDSLAARGASWIRNGSGHTMDGSARVCGMTSGVDSGSGLAMDGSATTCRTASGVDSSSRLAVYGSATACRMTSEVASGFGLAMDGSATAFEIASGVASGSGLAMDGCATACGTASRAVVPSREGAADPPWVSSRKASSCSSFCSKGSRSISRNSSTSPSHVSAAPISTNVSARALRSSRFFSPASGLQDSDALSYSFCSLRRRAVSTAISSRPRNARCLRPLVGSLGSANPGGEELSDITICPVSNVSPGGVAVQGGELRAHRITSFNRRSLARMSELAHQADGACMNVACRRRSRLGSPTLKQAASRRSCRRFRSAEGFCLQA